MSSFSCVMLIVLDGWGLSHHELGNAIKKASTPTIDKLNAFYPHLALQASGISVGLPWGEVGNSEVGHMTMGAGKIIYQNMPRITLAIQNGDFFKNPAFLKATEHVRKNQSALHIMGLVGQGGVHSYLDHLLALIEMAHEQKCQKLFIHVFTDGRDSDPKSAWKAISKIQSKCQELNLGKIATLSGRFFAMDRNNNWDRTEKAYRAMTEGQGNSINNIEEYLNASYAKNVFDEYLEPGVVMENNPSGPEGAGQPIGKIEDKDAVIFFNFREDRARQISEAFVLPGFMKFERTLKKDLLFVGMVEYDSSLPMEVAFPPVKNDNPLGKILSQNNLKQLRIAETEKFAHVTYFFNGGAEEAYPQEDRIIIPSAKTDSFDKVPEMSAREITEKVIEAVSQNKYQFILINFANADIVGHSGNEEATVKAVEILDECLAKIIPEVLSRSGAILITADHGNAEEVKNVKTGEIDTKHSENPVPLWFITSENHHDTPSAEENYEPKGFLSDIAPTILEILDIPKPKEMTGESLLPLLK